MICYQKQIVLNGRGEVVNLVPISDIHYGAKNCDKDKLKETVEWIRKEPNTYWLDMGDNCEYINYTDKRFQADNVDSDFKISDLAKLHEAQTNNIIKILSPIKDKCIGILEGNHEVTISEKYLTNPTDVIAHALSVPNLSYTAMVRLLFARCGKTHSHVDIFAWHGAGSAKTDGAAINLISSKASQFSADIFLMGHVHRKVCNDRDILHMNRSGVLMEKKQLFGVCGTFYRTYANHSSCYAEKAGYSPTPTGVLKIRIEPFRTKLINGRQEESSPHLHISA